MQIQKNELKGILLAESPSLYQTPVQEISFPEMDFNGRIIDIGGGGEGFVSRIAGKRVCLVDVRYSKILEARIHDISSSLIVSDGSQLCFKSQSFDVATMWFSLGYMADWKTKGDVLREISRVLNKKGKLILYAMHIGDSDIHVFNGLFTLPDGTQSKMSYRVRGGQKQDANTIRKHLENFSFAVCKENVTKYWSYIEAELDHPKP